MAKTITFLIQKGGAAKTTTAGVTAYLLSKRFKVLACDLDSQGNLTEMLTQHDIYDFTGVTSLQAMQALDARPYIHHVMDNLDILTADDFMATFSRWLYSKYKGNPSLVLRETLKPVQEEYDFILIDCPPALGDATINALAASDSAVVMFEPSRFCYSALGRCLETIDQVRDQLAPDLKVAGILTALIDKRRSDAKAFMDLLEEEYKGLLFNTIISRRASTGRLPISGFISNPELNDSIEPYVPFVEELLMSRA